MDKDFKNDSINSDKPNDSETANESTPDKQQEHTEENETKTASFLNRLKIESEDVVLPEYSEESLPKPKKQKIWLKVLFLIFNLIVVFSLIMIERKRAGSVPNLTDTLNSVENGWKYIICAILMFFVMILAEGGCYLLMLKVTNNGFRPWLAIKTILIGRYYDNVTPFSMGGQPFQMFYLKSRGVDSSTAYSAPLVRHAVKLLSVNIIIIIMYISVRTDVGIGIKIAAWVGIAFNVFFPAFMLLVALNKNVAFNIARWFLKIGCKLKIVKDYDKTVEKLIKQTEEFTKTLRFLGVHLSLFIAISVMSIIDVLALVSVPFFVIKGFGIDINYFDSVVRGMYGMNAASYVPTPGSSGGAEAYFYGLFGGILGTGNFFWGVMLWRMITFYSFLVIGIIININAVIKNSIKTGKYNRRIKMLIGEIEDIEKSPKTQNDAENINENKIDKDRIISENNIVKTEVIKKDN